jgi:SAM-dependent methyltransferase
MAEPLKRKLFQGVWTVIRFNWHLHAIALAIIMILLAGAVYLSGTAASACLILAVSAAFSIMLSLLATWIAYDAGGLYQLDWLESSMQGAANAANIHAGFDETTALLMSRFPHINWRIFDFYDPAKHTEISIRRARAAHPPYPGTLQITTGCIPLTDGSLDRVLLILAAHEIRDRQERIRFFRDLKRVLAPGGRVIVTEHLRDLANIAAYTIGAWHFHTRGEWLTTFHEAGFRVTRGFSNNPFITTFILDPDADTP